jgi:outer membrane protein assembly factor BamB
MSNTKRIYPVAVASISLGMALMVLPSRAAAENAPKLAAKSAGFRGDGTGRYPDATPPTQWDSESKKNILWTAKVGKTLHGSPVVVGGKVFTLSEPDKLHCIDANTGKELWARTTSAKDMSEKIEEVPTIADVGQTTPTPVTDGKFIYVEFANGLVTCFDMEGNRKWITFIDEPCETGNGRSASPCLVDGKLIVSMGKLTALDTKTGKTLWKSSDIHEVYGTPLAVKIGGSDMILTSTGEIVSAADGKVAVKGPAELTYSSPVVGTDSIFYIDADSGAVPLAKDDSAKKRTWQVDLEGEFFASPVYHEDLIYTVSNQGKFYVLDAKKGTIVYEKELDIANMSGNPAVPSGNIYASVCFAGKYILVGNDKGQTLVLEPGRAYKEVARNVIVDTIAGTMTFSGKRIYIRGTETLYCIGE